jgi:hypothetical protein
LFPDPAEQTIIEHAAIPAAEKDRGITSLRQLAPEACQPMTVGGLAAIVADAVDREMARVERRGELLERSFLARTRRTFEQNDCASAVRDLGQLQLANMLAQRGKSSVMICRRSVDRHAQNLPRRPKRGNQPKRTFTILGQSDRPRRS